MAFIMAARVSEPSDLRRAAAEILLANPLGGVCGITCPTTHCRDACARRGLDAPVEIPSVQATIVEMARRAHLSPVLEKPAPSGRKVAVIGAGPAGLSAAAMLARLGHAVVLFDEGVAPGGALHLIPPHRLPREIVRSDIEWILGLGDITLRMGVRVEDATRLLSEGFDGVVLAAGLGAPIPLGLAHEDLAIPALSFLANPSAFPIRGSVIVIGGGATAVDCAVTARRQGAANVELLCLERWDEMPLTASEREELLHEGIAISGRTRVVEILEEEGSLAGLLLERVSLPAGQPFHPRRVLSLPGTLSHRLDVRTLIVAIGARPGLAPVEDDRVVFAGDLGNGPTTVVTASASGKNAGLALDAKLQGGEPPVVSKLLGRYEKSLAPLPGYPRLPVPLDTSFFGRSILSPFLLSAAPPTDGYEQMRRAYEAGWAGGVMKTAFDGLDIHIPGFYMHRFGGDTYGNCDNVSGHALGRVCREIERLVREFPDRLTVGSTGGPVTGRDDEDRLGWQANTRKLESAGAMAIEYSLSCPQGGDGTEGDIVSQNARLTAKIIDWVMEVSDPSVPKLFKLTGAVTSVASIVKAVREVLDRHPHKKAGVTLANTFPALGFRKGRKVEWEEGVVVGLSGEGIVPISNLTLASVAGLGVHVSGNGGPMDYRSAAHFLALGAETVQFCTAVLKYGYGYVDDLHSGLSHLMAERGIASVAQLVGRALPEPIRGFMELSSSKRISAVETTLCLHCGNCTRCPYLAISLDERGVPVTDASRCVGCGLCTLKCFSGALSLRVRTPEEAAMLSEG
jgi:dihydropyrimidine dehydrogenase (NAD+) subunit PreA